MGGGGGGGGGEEEREGGPGRPATLGPTGPSLWASQARHSGPIRPVILRPVRPVKPAQCKARGLAAGFKKIKFRPGPVDYQRAYRPDSNRAAGLT